MDTRVRQGKEDLKEHLLKSVDAPTKVEPVRIKSGPLDFSPSP